MSASRFFAFLNQLTAKRRARYLEKKREKLTNSDFSIIGNNCICGMMYHDLNLPFTSPTIDTLIQINDFIPFVEHLEYYMTCVPEEIMLENVSYPVGVLRRGDEQVILRFMHDTTFEEAREKWVRRCARIRLDNLYVVYEKAFARNRIFMPRKNPGYQKFKALPCPNKRMLVNVLISFDKEVVPMPRLPFLKDRDLLKYLTRFSKKRRMDRFDYVSFLNQNRK